MMGKAAHDHRMKTENLKATAFEVLRDKAPLYSGEIHDDTSLGPDGLNIDSSACLEVLLTLEKQTGVLLRTENLTADALRTAGSLVQFLTQSARNGSHG